GEGRSDVLAVEVHRQSPADVDARDPAGRGAGVDLLGEVDGGADSDGGLVEADALRPRVDVDLIQPGASEKGLDEGLPCARVGEADTEFRGLSGGAQGTDQARARLRIDADPD